MRWFGDGPDNLLAAECLGFAEEPEDPAPKERIIEEGGIGRKGEVRLRLRGLCDRAAASALRGQWVLGESAELEALPEGEFYWYQLLGCQVALQNGQPLGRVRELRETGAHDILVVQGDDGREHLIPTAREVLLTIDIEAGRLVVANLPGLFEPARTTEAARPKHRKGESGEERREEDGKVKSV